MSGQKDIVVEAQRLCDYLLHKGGFDQAALIDALKPFEDPSQVAPDDYRNLRITFQASREKCLEIVDDLTLNDVLKGKSPYQQRVNVIASAGVTVISVILVAWAVYFNNWSERAIQLLAEADRYENFDHFGRMTRLVELVVLADGDGINGQEAFSALPSHSNPRPDLTPQQMIIFERMNELRRHYATEQFLFSNLANHSLRFNPVLEFRVRIQRRFCPALVRDGAGQDEPRLSIFGELLGCIRPNSNDGTALATLSQDNGSMVDDENFSFVAFWPQLAVSSIATYEGIELGAMEFARRHNDLDYPQAVQLLRNWVTELEFSLTTVIRVYLPVLYGALGSTVYCMWRILNPATSPLGFWHTVLRTSFAGLAALTLSALIVPSNVLAMGTEATRPFVYMLSFIFGYSIEAFVNTLNTLNRFLVSSIAPREKK